MPSTERRQRRIDAKLPETSAAVGTPVTTSAGTAISPEIPTPVAPSGLTATGTYVVNSAVTPQAVVNLRWLAVNSPTPDAYAIQWALDSGFTNPTTVITAREQVTAAVSGLPTNRTVWFRIAARWQWVQSAWSASISTTTANDTTPSALPTGATATFGNLTGNLTVDWINPTSANYRDIQISIYNQSGGTELRTEYVRDSPYVYSLDMNKTDTSSAGDPSLYLELRSRTFANVFSSTAVTLSPTFAVPVQVTGVTASANSVTGSLTFVYPSVATAIRYRLTLDGVARETTATTYEYTRALNEREHNGSFDTSIIYSIVAVDVFGQISATATTGTATFGVPANVGGVTTTLNTITGEAVWRWTALSNVTGYRLTIDGTARDVFTNEYRYSLAQNRAEHSGSIDTSLAWNLVAYNAVNQVSATATTGTASFTAPSTPTGLTVNFDNPDCVFGWTLGTDVTGYRLSIDDVVRDLGLVNRFTYTLGQNESEHTVAPTPDHTLTYILTAYNALEQTTSTTSATITSPAPNAPTAVTLTAYFNVLAAVITGHVRLPTHYRYKFEFRKDGATHKTIYSTENTASLEINETGNYIVRVSAEDVFGRPSSTLDSAVVAPDVLTLEELREDAIYSDSVGNTPATLDPLKDNNTTSGGVTYAAGTAWKWTRFERPMLDRYRTVTAGLFTQTAGTQIYFSTSSDNSTWQWWTGPLSSNRLISVGTEALAQSGAITIGTTYANTTRWDLASIVEARYIRIHHRNASNTYVMYEFYPRRLIQSDDIEAESILAINIAAGTITGNNIAGNTITATNIAANTITTQKLLVSGTGMSLTDDPNTVDISAWSGGTFTLVTDADSPNGNALQVTSQGTSTISNTYIPIDTAKNYIARIWCRQVSGTPLSYLFMAFYDSNKTLIQNSPPATGWGGGTFHYWGRINQLIPSTWTEYTISFGPNETPQIPATAKYIRIGVLANYNAAGTSRFTRFIVAEKTTGSLIVDGTITATKIAANTITANQIATGTITADRMSVTQLSAISANLGSITAGTVTGATIQTGASGARVVLDSTGLTTYNSAGTVQIQLPTSGNDGGRLIAGNVKLISLGLQTMVASGASGSFSLFWSRDTTDPLLEGSIGYVQAAWGTAGTNEIYLRAVQSYSSDTVFRVGLQSFNSSFVVRSQLDLNDTLIRLITLGNVRMSVSGSTVTLNDGVTIQGRGIQFDSTTSSDTRTLDDYDEGTWTPTVVFSGGTGGFTYDHQVGRYTKIGRLVHVQGSIQFDETAASGNLSIGGLPYSASTTTNNNAGGTLYADGLTGVSGQIMYLLGGAIADKQMEVYFSGTGGRTRITNTHTGTNTMFAFSICYHV